MRLLEVEVRYICAVFDDFSQVSAKLFLFGSRADESRKGGDINLAYQAAGEKHFIRVAKSKWEILSLLKSKIGEQKIDLTFTSLDQLAVDPWLQKIHPTPILLKAW